MSNTKIILAVAVVVIVVAAGLYVGLGGDDDDAEVTINVSGSTTVEPLMLQFKTAYEKKYPNVTINVSGGGSGQGASKALQGVSDIGMLSRDLKGEEVSGGLVPVAIAKDGVAVIVGQGAYNGGITNLTPLELAKIFSKQTTKWKDLDGPDEIIVPITRDAKSGTRDCFDSIMKSKLEGYEVPDTVNAVDSNGVMVTTVDTGNYTIGYIGFGYMSQLTKAKAINVDGVKPTSENVLRTENPYPLSRDLILATKGEAKGEVKKFIDWILGAEGQAIVENKDYIPVGAGTSGGSDGINLKVSGSTSVLPLMLKFKEEYEKKFPNATINVSGGGSGSGASNAINGVSDIGMLSRELKGSEVTDGLVAVPIAKDGVAIIVGKGAYDAGAKDLTPLQIAKIFSGQIENWNEIIPGYDHRIVPVTRDAKSGTRDCFDSMMKSVLSGYAVPDSISPVDSNGVMATTVDGNPNAIGYIGFGYIGQLTKAKAIKVNGVEPTAENVLRTDNPYPISRNLNLATKGAAKGDALVFINWILGPEGQQYVAEKGFIAIPS